MKKFRNEKQKNIKGITLISLVITIIILIILAGVSINLVLGENGLFTKAREAQAKFLNAQAEEEERIAELEKEIADNENLPANTEDTLAGTQVKLPSKWVTTLAEEYSTENGSKVKSEVRVANVRAIATGKGEEVPVPKGFYYVGGTIESGVVISDNPDDQNKFVNAEDGNVPAGVVYNEDGTVNTASSALKGNQFVWIPVELNNYKKTKWTKDDGTEWKALQAERETQTNTAELIQIEKYGGFYVGRYEAGTSNITLSTNVDFSKAHTTDNWCDDRFSLRDELGHTVTKGKITCKAGEIPYYHADYFTALKLCNDMYKTDYVQSGLVTGTMWDTMLKFIANGNTDIVTNSANWGNYMRDTGIEYNEGQGRYAIIDVYKSEMTNDFTKSDTEYYKGIRTTASSESLKKKNLYDVAGNLWEWTQEAIYQDNGLENYTIRGGSCLNSETNFPACVFGSTGDVASSYLSNGFRPALYIK